MSVVKKQTVTKAWLNSAANASQLNAGDFYVVERDGTYQATNSGTFVKIKQADIPEFGTAAAKNVEDFASAAQGATADAAIQKVTINGQTIAGPGDHVINTNAQLWVSGTAYPISTYVVSPLSSHVYMKRTTSGASTTDPANDKTNWRLIGAGGIKSIQRGAIAMPIRGETAAVTISPVSTSSCNLVLMGAQYTGAGNFASSTMQVRGVLVSLELTNSTTITASRGASTNQDLGAVTVFWELTEYWS